MTQINKSKRRLLRSLSCHRTRHLTHRKEGRVGTLHRAHQAERSTSDAPYRPRLAAVCSCSTALANHLASTVTADTPVVNWITVPHWQVRSRTAVYRARSLATARTVRTRRLTSHRTRPRTKACHSIRILRRLTLQLCSRWWPINNLEERIIHPRQVKTCFIQGRKKAAQVPPLTMRNLNSQRALLAIKLWARRLQREPAHHI